MGDRKRLVEVLRGACRASAEIRRQPVLNVPKTAAQRRNADRFAGDRDGAEQARPLPSGAPSATTSSWKMDAATRRFFMHPAAAPDPRSDPAQTPPLAAGSSVGCVFVPAATAWMVAKHLLGINAKALVNPFRSYFSPATLRRRISCRSRIVAMASFSPDFSGSNFFFSDVSDRAVRLMAKVRHQATQGARRQMNPRLDLDTRR